jgi:hypothetical protein
MRIIGKGILTDKKGEFLVVKAEPDNNPPFNTAKHDFYLARRFFIENSTPEIAGAPHWVSFYENWGFRIDWFPEPKEFEISTENTV